jgi:alkaline phosphatase D
MTLSIDRRLLIKGSILGLGALAIPGAAAMLSAKGFTHGIASGEPAPNSVLLWTRFVAANDTKLRCEVATDSGFAKVVSGGEVISRGEADHTAKLTVSGLRPATSYFYRFIAPDGSKSPVGRTRTLPEGEVARFGLALFSCSNLPFGWFNAYGHAAQRNDIDLVVHCGDYIYELQTGRYPSAKDAVPGRILQPTHEILTLADYRLRYACYRLDPDLQQLHARFPMIAQWDDHELANDAWVDGAENHQPDTEGDWATRKAIAQRVYREWMPVSDALYNSFEIGSLATLFRPETRIVGRMEQLDLDKALAGRTDLDKAIAEFRDGPWSAADRTMMGMAQEKWLHEGIAASTRKGTTWQIVAQQVVMGNARFPSQAANWVTSSMSEFARQFVLANISASKAGLPFMLHAWDGYPAARTRLYEAALAADANMVVLSGDSHNAWGFNLGDHASSGKRIAAGVEFAGQSVTSPGFEAFVPGGTPSDIAKGLMATNSDLAFSDTSNRGYVSLEINPAEIVGTWHFMADVRTRTPALSGTHTMRVRKGLRTLEAV